MPHYTENIKNRQGENENVHVFSISEFTQAIKNKLETAFPSPYLKGEISNLKVQSSGHMYFSLKDTGAQISCVMFRFDLAKVGFPIKEGDTVIVRGELTVYPPRGNYQLICKEISLSGLGELLLELEKRKQKLQALGYFALERKRPLPRFPKTIAVVTSPTGAVIQDIIHILSRRCNSFHLILNPVRVQGDGAAEEIAQAIDECNRHAVGDVIIVCRGGGSIEDLMPFNSEKVAEAIFKSKIPVISAVGHETDVTIADLVADIRAPTPSGAAEIAATSSQELADKTSYYRDVLEKLIHRKTGSLFEKLEQVKKQRLCTHPLFIVTERIQSLDTIKESLDIATRTIFSFFHARLNNYSQKIEMLNPQKQLLDARKKLDMQKRTLAQACLRAILERKENFSKRAFKETLTTLITRKIEERKNVLHRLHATLNALNPHAILAKGYSIAFKEKEPLVVHSIQQVAIGERLQLQLHDGKITVEVVGTI